MHESRWHRTNQATRGGRRCLGAALLAVLLGGLLAGLLPARPAAAAVVTSGGSIVFVKNNDIWLTSPDGATQRQVTTNGSVESPDMTGSGRYQTPSQSDGGEVIVAVRNEGRTGDLFRLDGYLWVMDRQGGVIRKFRPPQGIRTGNTICGDPVVVAPRGIIDAAVSPNGLKVAYVSQWNFHYCDRVVEHTQMWVVNIDGSNAVEIKVSSDENGDPQAPSWVSDTRLLLSTRFNSTYWLDLPGTGATGWGSIGMEPDFKAGKLASVGLDINYAQRMFFYTSAGPPSAPSYRCRFDNPSGGAGARFGGPSWAPDGKALVWTESDGVADETGEGLWIVPVGDLATSCPSRTDQRLLAAGVTEAHWGAAPVNGTLPTLAVNDVSLAEGDSGPKAATFTITRSGNLAAPSSVTWATANGTATAGSDYVGVGPTVVNFAANEPSKLVTVTVTGDTTVEPNETFSVNLSAATGATIADGTGTGTITNDDATSSTTSSSTTSTSSSTTTSSSSSTTSSSTTSTTVSPNRTYLHVEDLSVVEGDAGTTTATFRISRSGTTTGASSVNWATADGTATRADGDYQAASGTVSFAPGDTTKSVSVTITGDNKSEADENLFVRLSAPTGAVISDSSGTATIVNDDGVAQLRIGDASVAEGTSGTRSVSFTITRSGAASGASSVKWATANGSATTADSDYVVVAPTLVEFAPGETTKTVTATVNGDTKTEPDETFAVKLSAPSGGVVTDDTGIATIVNDDGAAQLRVNDASVIEGDAGPKTATFTITRSGTTAGPSSVQWATANSTATVAGGDFVGVGPTLVQFASGETSKSISVTVNGDTTSESDEVFSVKLSAPSGAVIADDTGTGTIVNDDGAAQLHVDDVSVVEGASGTKTATFTISRSGSTGGTASVRWSTANGTATAVDDDYVTASSTAIFAAGQTTHPVTITVNGDTKAETDETFYLRLSAPAGAVIADDAGLAAIVNDDGSTYLSISDVSVAEGGTATFNVTRAGSTAGASGVSWATANGTATAAGGDYTAGSGMLSFAAGETTKSVPVAVGNDTVDEANEGFAVVLSAPVGGVLSDGRGTATIVDDDGPVTPGPATFLSVDDVSVAEGGSGTATFTVTRSGDTTGSSSAKWYTQNGSASAGSDYVAVPSTTVSFGPGEVSKPVTVTLVGDTTSEGHETFYVRLGTPVGATIADDAGVATILNDDGSAQLRINDVSVTEGNSGTTAANFTITRSGDTTGTSTAKWYTQNASATAGTDFVAVVGTTVSFAPGETTKSVSVAVNGETAGEFHESFYVRLGSPVGAVVADDTGVATILNDDGLAQVRIDDVSITEGDVGTTAATFTVSRTGDTSGTSSVRWYTQNLSALSGTDYGAVAATTLSFAPGETNKTVSVTVNGDTIAEGHETFFVRLSTPVGATISDDAGLATIANDDAPVQVWVDDVVVTEGNSGSTTATFTVARSVGAAGTSSVNWYTQNSSATAGSDYVAVPTTALTFGPGETTKAVSVTVNGDAVPEANEAFYVRLTAPVGAKIADDLGAATVLNDDGASYLRVNDVWTAEGGSGSLTATFSITRSGATAAASSVTWYTQNGSAVAGTDYVAVPATVVTFAPGETTKHVEVVVNGDALVEADEAFSVRLTSPIGATLSDETGVGTIGNDD